MKNINSNLSKMYSTLNIEERISFRIEARTVKYVICNIKTNYCNLRIFINIVFVVTKEAFECIPRTK